MQVGCGIDFSSYAMARKAGKNPAVGCGVILGSKTIVHDGLIIPRFYEIYFRFLNWYFLVRNVNYFCM